MSGQHCKCSTRVGYFYYGSGTVLVVGGNGDSAFLLGPALVELLVERQMLIRAASAMSFRKRKFKNYTHKLTDCVCFTAPFLSKPLANTSCFLDV